MLIILQIFNRFSAAIKSHLQITCQEKVKYGYVDKFLHTKILFTWFPTQDDLSFYKKKMFWIMFPIAFENIIV